EGANQLIRDGAGPALDPSELLESLPLAVKEELDRRAAAGAARDDDDPGAVAPGLARLLLAELAIGDPTTAEELSRRSGQSVDRVLAVLLDLELDGRVGRVAGSRY